MLLAALPLLGRDDPPRPPKASRPSEKHREKLDPAAWGRDHVGKPMPEFIESGECLFCHRADVGGTWDTNRHAVTVHDALADSPPMVALSRDKKAKPIAGEVTLLLGDTRQQCFLRRGQQYGTYEVLSVRATSGRGTRFRLTSSDDVHWDRELFAKSCSGCHTTGVNAKTGAFSLPTLDCYVCHGDATLDHSNEPSLVHLAKSREDSPLVVISICAQCHIRFGKSKSTGRPYPNNFVAGDNLFRDFEVDFSLADDPSINPSDRHVLDNVREVVLYGRKDMTCLSCHDVHTGSSARHRELADENSCKLCHDPDRPKTEHIRYQVKSGLCGY